MARIRRFTDCDTGESTVDFVDSYTGKLSLQMALVDDVDNYISLLLSLEDENELFELLSERRIARLPH